jgi:peptidoglycan LD-endopeptidase CwlK
MPKFGKRSAANLAEANEDLQVLFNEVVNEYDCSVIEGRRGEAEQNSLFAAGKSKLKFPKSKHNSAPGDPCDAVDVVPYPIDWNDRDRFMHFGGYVLGVAHRLYQEGRMNQRIRWGGDWNGDNTFNESFWDAPHFETVE